MQIVRLPTHLLSIWDSPADFGMNPLSANMAPATNEAEILYLRYDPRAYIRPLPECTKETSRGTRLSGMFSVCSSLGCKPVYNRVRVGPGTRAKPFDREATI